MRVLFAVIGSLVLGCTGTATPGPVPPPDVSPAEPTTSDALEAEAVALIPVDIGAPGPPPPFVMPDPPDVPPDRPDVGSPDVSDVNIEPDIEPEPEPEPEPDVTEEDVAPPVVYTCTQDDQRALYAKRIEPLFNGSQPSSCNQCHLSGIDLSMYAKGTPCATMACLISNEKVDLEAPADSEILAQIQQADPASPLIDDNVIEDEYGGFLEWITYSAQCHATVCGVVEDPCADPDAPVAALPGGLTPLGACAEPSLVADFSTLVMKHKNRCHGCHSSCKPDYPAPCWLVEDYDAGDPAALEAAAIQTMYNLIGLGAIDVDAPSESLMLLKPASSSLGGVYHGGGSKFYDLADQTYQDFLQWIEAYAACYLGVEPQKPVVKITLPVDKKKVTEGLPLTLKGNATDLQDEAFADEAFVWTSSKTTDPVFVGPEGSVSTLPTGKHLLTLTVTDADGNAGTRTVKIWIKKKPTPPPEE